MGIDVGTTTTQMVVSRLTAQNKAGAFAVPRLDITKRTLIYESPVHFTPLLGTDLVDGAALERLLREEYARANIRPEDVDTGAVIITGETSRRENAETVLRHLSHLAGDFVVATAGPDLESILAAKGAGATELSATTGKQVLHMALGGGTSNLCLIEEGQTVKTGCLNVGGRLITYENRRITYLSPVAKNLTHLQVGDPVTEADLLPLAEKLTQALEMAAGKRPATELLQQLTTKEAADWTPVNADLISFSGGVADCVKEDIPWDAYGDLGPVLGRCIRKSFLTPYHLADQTIRATVMGAGCHATQLSGSTVYHRGVTLPVQNLPVVAFAKQELVTETAIAKGLSRLDTPGILAMPGFASPSYEQVRTLAQTIIQGVGNRDIYVTVEQDMAKALGQAMALLSPQRAILCLDGLPVQENCYLDVGKPVGPALPVIIKTLIL